jgi:3-hydroxyisobutyrate dehydrogenase-like beta-hydroxyacid dehydrogenase
MTTKHDTRIAFLGLGAMGGVLAAATLDAGHPTTVWNRTPGRAQALIAKGATNVATAGDAIATSALVVACLFDDRSVRDTLEPLAAELSGRTLINLTTTTPNQARALGEWAARHDVAYLDGGIMAVPSMIGAPGASILYSGSASAFERYRPVLDHWAESTYLGTDAGMASLQDLAMLAGMYVMFGGFMHGAAMVGSAGVGARAFAARVVPFLSAMTQALPEYAAIIDARSYRGEGQQSLEFSDLGPIVQASVDQGVSPDILLPVHTLIRKQIAAGHGKEGFSRIFEGLRIDAATTGVRA